MTTDAQKELCGKLDAPSYTADDYMVMAEAANEIRYLTARLEELEQAGRRTTPDREAWISVDERMPDENSVVLVAGWCFGRPKGERFVVIARRDGATFLNEETGDDLFPITHWMPLPAAPTSDKGD